VSFIDLANWFRIAAKHPGDQTLGFGKDLDPVFDLAEIELVSRFQAKSREVSRDFDQLARVDQWMHLLSSCWQRS